MSGPGTRVVESGRYVRGSIAGVFHATAGLAQRVLGRPARLHSPDRQLLEQRILPAFGRDPRVRRALFVGCAPYTQHYPALLQAAVAWTIDADPKVKRYGATRHLVAPLQDLRAHDTDGSFDLIVCNGVLGWGLDAPHDIERAMRACHDALHDEGWLLLGWNDYPPRNRVRPEHIAALGAFEHSSYAGLPSRIRVRSAVRHVFDTYCRRAK